MKLIMFLDEIDILEDKKALRKYIFSIFISIFVNFIFPLLLFFIMTYFGPILYRMCVENN